MLRFCELGVRWEEGSAPAQFGAMITMVAMDIRSVVADVISCHALPTIEMPRNHDGYGPLASFTSFSDRGDALTSFVRRNNAPSLRVRISLVRSGAIPGALLGRTAHF